MTRKPNTRRLDAFLVPGLFAVLIGLQVLDWHSTVLGGAGVYESNKLLNSLSTSVPFTAALALAKAFDLLAICTLFWAWRISPRLSRAFAMCLGVLVAVYGAVVINNYLTH